MQRQPKAYRTVHSFLANLSDRTKPQAVLHPHEAGTDRVVEALLKRRVVSKSEVESKRDAWTPRDKHGGQVRFWRVLAETLPERAEVIRATAASVYAFAEEAISIADAVAFMRSVHQRFTADQWTQLVDSGVVPIRASLDATGRERLIFVSSDPSRLELQPLLHGLVRGPFELRYADSASITFLLGRIVPLMDQSNVTQTRGAINISTPIQDVSPSSKRAA